MEDSVLAGLPLAPAWSLAAGEAGKAMVLAGLGLFIASILLWALAKARPKLERPAAWAIFLACANVFGAMAVLVALFVRNQFQFEYVFGHSDASAALPYRVAAVWAGQQGSFILWAACSALFGLLAWRGTGHYRRWYAIVFSLFLGALCGILAYETPFNLLADAQAHGKVFLPQTGTGLNPVLRNYWIVIHPPVIFMGFGALTVLFAYAVSAIAVGDVEGWVPRVRPWALANLAILGIGICMGGFWAYETLGWGGFWAWDPVENASFVPWLVVAGFVHGAIVQTNRRRWHGANLVLAGAPFLLFVYGTLLTRSGMLTDVSVHSFAKMDASALKVLLGLLVAALVGFAGLFLLRGLRMAREASRQGVLEEGSLHREAFYRFGVLMLSLLALVIAIGMSWPVIQSLLGQRMAVVEESLYHRVVVWFFLPIMLLAAVGPFVSWRNMKPKELALRIANIVSFSALVTGLAVWGFRSSQWGVHVGPSDGVAMPGGRWIALLPWMGLLTFVCAFTAIANLWRIVEMWRRSRPSIGSFVSHIGLAVLMGGLILSRGFEQKAELVVADGQPAHELGMTVTFKGLSKSIGDPDNRAVLEVEGAGERFTARPGMYFLAGDDGQDRPMMTPHIERRGTHDVYVHVGEPQIFVWDEPVMFKVGESQTLKGIEATYLRPTVQGSPGQPGTKFGAVFRIAYEGKTHEVEPQFEVGRGPLIARIDDVLSVAMTTMDPASGKVGIQILFAKPLFPVALFMKPLTSLVWAGAGILFLGGMIAAVYRRPRHPKLKERAEDVVASDDNEHAPVPTA